MIIMVLQYFRIVIKDKPRKVYCKKTAFDFEEAEKIRKECVKLGYKRSYIVVEEYNANHLK